MNILITGCNGQLGSELRKILSDEKGELGPIPEKFRGAKVLAVDIADADLTGRSAAFDIVNRAASDLVINCCAYTNVDGCETNRETAFAANALIPQYLAEACAERGAELVHVSTDYVFDGEADTPYTEYDLPRPVSVYGKTKLAGENAALRHNPRTYIVRTSWLYGYNGKNFVKTMLRLAREKGGATVVSDQYGNPTSAADVAHAILKIAAGGTFGIYHATCNGICSWYEFASEAVRLSGIDAEIKPCTSEEYVSPTKRPAYSALDNMMQRMTVGDDMRDWREALSSFFKNYKGD